MVALDGRYFWLALCLLPAGCITLEQPKTKPSLLGPAQMTPDAVALEIVPVRLPPRSAELERKVWEEVDEQPLPPELRRRLARHGFRAGVAGRMPAALVETLAMKDKLPASDEPQKLSASDLTAPPRVLARRLQVQAAQRSEIVASGVHESWPVLVCEDGELCGRTYHEAQGVFALAAFPQADGRVRLELVPELHHDHSRPHWVGDQATWRLDSARPRRVFDDLKLSTVLRPGSMLIIGGLPDRAGSLGDCFFTDDSGSTNTERKVLLVRVCQTQHDDLVLPPPLPPGP
jgi:hypothetical protein